MWNVWGTDEVYTGLWWEDLSERYRLEDLNVERRIILKCIFQKLGGKAWTGLIWLRIGTGGGRL